MRHELGAAKYRLALAGRQQGVSVMKHVKARLGPAAALARRRKAGPHEDRRTKRARSRTDQRTQWRKEQDRE